jgi:hypothetical protein
MSVENMQKGGEKMYKVIDHADYNAGIKEYVVDTMAELESLSGDMGSSAFCFETMKFYLKDG